MTTNPAEPGPHLPESPTAPDEADVETGMPGVDPDWPQTVEG